MAKPILKDVHLLLDLGTLGKLRDIAGWSEEAIGLGKTIRAVTKRYYALLSRQMQVEVSGGSYCLVQLDSAGKEVGRERASFQL